MVCVTGLREEEEHDKEGQKLKREMIVSWGRGQPQQTEEN